MKLESIIDESHTKKDDIGLYIRNLYKDINIEITSEGSLQVIVIDPSSKKKESSLLLEFDGPFIGSYDPERELWLWNFNNYVLSKKEKKFMEKVDDFKDELLKNVNKYKDKKYVEMVYNYLSNEIVAIKSDNLFIMVKIFSHIFKGNGIITRTTTQSGIEKIDFFVIEHILVDNVKRTSNSRSVSRAKSKEKSKEKKIKGNKK